jgi:asparagine synthetase B (glutamine-hydrolysing)
MAGFVGSCGRNKEGATDQEIMRAVGATVYSAKTTSVFLYRDHRLALARSFFDFMEMPKVSSSREDLLVWIDGEVFNETALNKNQGIPFVDLVHRHYKEGTLDALLKDTDGVFVIILYDVQTGTLHLITDRFGLKPFYLYQRNGQLIFAAELKCFPLLKNFNLVIRKDLIDCFIKLEHLLGTATWFEGVEFLRPASVYTYRIDIDDLSVRQYWNWGMIRENRSVSIEQAADEMGSLLDSAIQSRSNSNARVGISLSGGLDSRAILASVYRRKPVTYTFGLEDSRDVKIARQVSRKAGVKHLYFDIRTDHWLEHRFRSVWRTDGMENMYHFHFSHIIERVAESIDVNLNGFLGDAVLGGSYLGKKKRIFLNTRISPEIARYYYGEHAALCDPSDPYFDLDKIDPYLIYNRGRRFINMGTEDNAKTIPQRLPFFENKLIEFAYSLDDKHRLKSKVYNRALLRKYGEFYTTIPNAATGVPLAEAPSLKQQAISNFNHYVDKFRYKLGIPTSYTDVYNWIKNPDTAALIMKILDPKKALYSQFRNINYIEQYVLPHLNRRINFSKQIMGALTFEIWLQQVLAGKYRSDKDAE